MGVRLSLFWFTYMVGLGTFFPFFSLYLRQRLGMSGTQVGLVTAMIPLVGLLVQPLWGYLADRTGSRRRILVVVSAGVGVANLALGYFHGFTGVLLGTALLALFSTVVISMATAVSLGATADQGPHAFGIVRMWGTLGFLAAVVCFPRVLESFPGIALGSGPWHGLGLMFPIIAVFSLVAAAVAATLPASRALELRSRPGDTRQLLRHPPVVRLLLFVFAIHCCVQGPIYLFPLYITERGGDVSSLGNMWIFMLLLEIPLIGFLGSALRRVGPRGLLLLGIGAEAIRWGTCAFTDNLSVITAVQLLHGVGVAGIILGAPLYLEQAVPERQRSTGQAMVSAAGFGAGSIFSNTLGGLAFDHLGPEAPYFLSSVGTTLLALLLLRGLPRPYRPEEV